MTFSVYWFERRDFWYNGTVPGGIPGGSLGPAIAGSMPALSVREVRGAIGDIWIEPRSLPLRGTPGSSRKHLGVRNTHGT